MKKIIALILLVSVCVGILGACAPEETAYALSANKGEDIQYFFMDREYALDSAHTNTTKNELKKAEKYLKDHILKAAKTKDSAFDFKIGEISFAEDIKNWDLTAEETADTEVRTDWTLTYVKKGCPITVTVYATLYKEYAIIEWTVWLSNTGNENSEQISEFYGLTDTFAQDNQGDITLTTFEGSHESTESFKAEARILEEGAKKMLSGSGGKSSVTWAPYANLQWENEKAAWGKEGVFISNGWSGQWATNFENTAQGVSVVAKQESLNTYLKPGEQIRSPLITLLFWEKDFMRSQNLWRRWVYNIAMPQPNGEPIKTNIFGNTAGYTALTVKATTENQLKAIEWWAQKDLGITYWQMDAGWYDMANDSTSWTDTGSWTPSQERFNGTLKPITDKLHENGLGLILWYEPERLVTNSDFYNRFKGTDYIIENVSGWHCFNLSNDEATDWLIDYICNHITENGVDIYRQDCNLNGGASLKSYWQSIEEEGRKGYVENRYIINYLRYFDAILEHTGTYIDNCASGGKRLDLESTKRSVALWRDDNNKGPIIAQCQSWGINFYMPYSGHGIYVNDKYASRSELFTSNGYTFTPMEQNHEGQVAYKKEFIDESLAYAPFLTQDYYPLTPFNDTENTWMAWQFNDYKTSTGIIQVFKRGESTETTQTYYLSGLDANASYIVTDIDTNEPAVFTGLELMTNGFTVNIEEVYTAKIFTYKPV